jgi:hypothetical protein
MPHVENRLVTIPFDHPRHPLCPIAVGLVVTDEDFGSGASHYTLRECLSDPTGFVMLELYLKRRPENLQCLAD